MASANELSTCLRSLGVREGDVVLVHSALKRLGVAGGAEAVIAALRVAVGASGTVAAPTHTWRTVSDEQPVWHQVHSPSITGKLSEVLRRMPEAVRSLHPTHSIAAIGARARELVAEHERDETPCDPRGPYGRLASWGGRIVLLGVDLDRCTFIHCCEEVAGCGPLWSIDPVARPRWLIRADGVEIATRIRGHINGVSDRYPKADPLLRAAGCLRRADLDGCPIAVLDCAPAMDVLVPLLRREPKWFWDSPDRPVVAG